MAVSLVERTANHSTGSPVISVPTGTQEGDLLLLIAGNANQSFPPPDGWTPLTALGAIGRGTGGGATSVAIQAYWKRAGASEPSVTLPDTGTKNFGAMYAWRGALASDTPCFERASTSNVSTSSGYGALSGIDADSALFFAAMGGDNSISLLSLTSDIGSLTPAHADGSYPSGFRYRSSYISPVGITSKSFPSGTVTLASSGNIVGYAIEILAEEVATVSVSGTGVATKAQGTGAITLGDIPTIEVSGDALAATPIASGEIITGFDVIEIIGEGDAMAASADGIVFLEDGSIHIIGTAEAMPATAEGTVSPLNAVSGTGLARAARASGFAQIGLHIVFPTDPDFIVTMKTKSRQGAVKTKSRTVQVT